MLWLLYICFAVGKGAWPRLQYLLREATNILETREWQASGSMVSPLVEHLGHLAWQVVGGRLQCLTHIAHPTLWLLVGSATNGLRKTFASTCHLTRCCLVTPYGIMNHSHHWFRWWLVAYSAPSHCKDSVMWCVLRIVWSFDWHLSSSAVMKSVKYWNIMI